jgi:hypothetical protein
VAIRHWFGQSLTDWTFTLGGGNEAILASGEVTFWDSWSGGSQHTDLLDENGDPITSVTTSDGSSLPLGSFPRFQGPEGVTSMWADAGGGPRFIMVATDLGDVIGDDLATQVNDLVTVVALTPLVWAYDTVAEAWNPRPAIAGSRCVIWLGPIPPPVGGSPEYMRSNVDTFMDWQP